MTDYEPVPTHYAPEPSAQLNRDNAMTARNFHPVSSCAQTVTIGPRGGRTVPTILDYRRNGRTQTWKTRPAEFRIPVKRGLRDTGNLTDYDAGPRWHTGRAEDCTLGTLRASIAAAFPEYQR